MKVHKILVVEDDHVQRHNLKKMIEACGSYYKVYQADGFENALGIALKEEIDMFFLDIDINSQKTGYELAKALRNMPQYKLVWIVFLTVRSEYEREAFKIVHCYDYLIKPFNQEAIAKCLETLLENPYTQLKKVDSKPTVTFNLDNVTLKLVTEEILFIEAKGRNVLIKTLDALHEMPYTSLKKMETKLKTHSEFVKVHRSFIVNVNHVRACVKHSYRENWLEFYVTDDKIPISLSYKDKLEVLFGNENDKGDAE